MHFFFTLTVSRYFHNKTCYFCFSTFMNYLNISRFYEPRKKLFYPSKDCTNFYEWIQKTTPYHHKGWWQPDAIAFRIPRPKIWASCIFSRPRILWTPQKNYSVAFRCPPNKTITISGIGKKADNSILLADECVVMIADTVRAQKYNEDEHMWRLENTMLTTVADMMMTIMGAVVHTQTIACMKLLKLYLFGWLVQGIRVRVRKTCGSPIILS